jgi:hypothetical protein
MGFFGKAAKGALAAKVISEARKPENQAKAKAAAASLRTKLAARKRPTAPR